MREALAASEGSTALPPDGLHHYVELLVAAIAPGRAPDLVLTAVCLLVELAICRPSTRAELGAREGWRPLLVEHLTGHHAEVRAAAARLLARPQERFLSMFLVISVFVCLFLFS